MSSRAGNWVEIYTPAELGLAGVNTGAAATTDGSFVDIQRYDDLMIVLVCSGGTTTLPTVRLRFRGVNAAGANTPWITIRPTTADAWVAGPVAIFQVGPDRGTCLHGNEATVAPTIVNTFAALDRVAFQLQIVGTVAGTADLHLFAKTADVR